MNLKNFFTQLNRSHIHKVAISYAIALIRLVAITLAVVLATASSYSESWQPHSEAQRCPSKWGAGDQRGSRNHIKPQTVLRAVKLIKTGEMIELGYVLNSSMPFVAGRRFDVHTKPTFMNPEGNHRGSNEELVIGEIGQMGTQLDGFAHQTIGNSLYNCCNWMRLPRGTAFLN